MSTAVDVYNIFNHPPAPECSRVLRVDGTGAACIFRALMAILKCGLAMLYGQDGVVQIDTICEKDIGLLQQYFLSFGIALHINVVKEVPRRVPVAATGVLRDYMCVIQTRQNLITISFDYYMPDMKPCL